MIRDSLAEDIQLMMIAIEIEDKDLMNVLLNSVKRDVTNVFKRDMPKKYLIFNQTPNFYFISKVFCIEFPSWGSDKYRELLNKLGKKLRDFCITDISYFDGKTTFLIRGVKEEFYFK